MRTWNWMVAASLLLTLSAAAQQGKKSSSPAPKSSAAQPSAVDQISDRIVQREHVLIDMLKTRTPLVETYLQNLKPDPLLGAVPKEDHYFLGRLDISESMDRRDYLTHDESFEKNLMGGVTKLFRFEYKPMGFSWMIFVDRDDFDKEHYSFKYVGRDFLGEVRCLMFDITPQKDAGKGRFLGRIWVEDQNYNIVRLNGTYVPRPRNSQYFHMDSWRLNLIPGLWVPAYIYSEEGDFSYGAKDRTAFKAQSRIWGYDLKKSAKEDELTQLTVDAAKDETPTAADPSPLEAQRQWLQQAEDNVVERLQESGLLAPPGEVDKVLQTVINNLVVTNNLEVPRPVRARVMLTSPLETFSVGNTIIVSRGLVDVLPDEASLAMVLSHELAHIVLGHNLGSKFAFNDRMLFSDESTYSNFGFRHNPDEETAADAKAMVLLKNSPYAQKLDAPSLFLKQLSARAPELLALTTAHLGNSLTDDKGQLTRLTALASTGPALDPAKLDQIAALPLGARVKMNPWDNHIELIKSGPVAITSPRDKMPFEVTPFFPRLTRLPGGDAAAATTSAANTSLVK
jgi:hypothetical protein